MRGYIGARTPAGRALVVVLAVWALLLAAMATPAAAGPRVTLSGPGQGVVDQQVRLTVAMASHHADQRVILKKRIAGEWQRVARKRLNSRGRATFLRTHSVVGIHRYRAFVRTYRSNRLAITVSGPSGPPPTTTPPAPTPTEPAPATTTPPTTSTPPPDVPPVPDLPPYPGASATLTAERTPQLVTDPLNCWTGVVGTNHQGGTGNGYEWEFWIPVLWGYTPGSGWAVAGVGSWHYRDSRPNYITGTQNAWLTYPSGATNQYGSWFWSVNSGFWYAVQNWGYANSAGYSSTWATPYGDSSYPPYCWA